MPCFKGLAVSIHTPDGPLPEYSVQKQSRVSRITSYIPVPPPKIPDASKSTPEQSTFAISITLLTPWQNVPYSTPKPTPDNPNPKPKIVGTKNGSSIGAYQPMTGSPNETVAAYIYFDGRQKEEVATLLRRGEETWVNSRWVGVPESEGGGLAEREFLFREVGLERWLNGLDLDGKDAAAKIERRRQKMERRRRRRESGGHRHGAGDMDMDGNKPEKERDVLRYGNNAQSPVENLSDEEVLSSESDLEDDDPIPETAGQIKVALFRVLASGEIKRGEYSPQFDAHDDDDDPQGDGSGQGNDADVDHTTSFAKPKTLDPKSISTQTVTGIDPSDRPYAVFTFMYRGERQLQKMGILNPSKTENKEAASTKRASLQTDFANLAPLKPGPKAGFTNFRDSEGRSTKARKKSVKGSESDMDSDDEEVPSIIGRADAEESTDNNTLLSPDDVKQQGELAEGVRQIKLKRQHSAEPLNAAAGSAAATSTSQSNTPASVSTPPTSKQTTTPPNERLGEPEPGVKLLDNEEFVGSPLKKQRASLSGTESESLRKRIGPEMSANIHEVMGINNSSGLKNQTTPNSISTEDVKVESTMEEEEL